VPDDIFDYFSGNSPRKVEPLDESELFEDLLPQQQEPQVEVGEQDREHDIVDVELVRQSAEDEAADDSNPVAEAGAEEERQAKDPWSDLAASLGLEPTPVDSAVGEKGKTPEHERTSADRRKDPVATENAVEASEEGLKSAQRVVEKRTASPGRDDRKPSVDSPGRASRGVPSRGEDAADDSRRQLRDSNTEEADEDDLFAAFRGSDHREVEGASAELDLADIEDEAVADEVEFDPDFVEFEVKDLGGRVDEDREERTERRPRRRSRGRGEENAREEQQRPASRQQEVPSVDDGDRRERSKRRGGRRRSRESIERPDDYRPATSSDNELVSEASDRARQKERPRDDDGENAARDRKKTRIPTWQEAIAVVVDANIRRHESNPGSGRGGKRRRRD